MSGWRATIAVCGAGTAEAETDALAFTVGRLLGERGALVVCGGLRGVMEAACRGAKAGGGTTVGILPGYEREHANPFVDIVIPTGMGQARNAIVVASGQAVIAIKGEYGTLSEIALALKLGIPVVGLHTWDLPGGGRQPGLTVAASPEAAVELALAAAEGRGPRRDPAGR